MSKKVNIINEVNIHLNKFLVFSIVYVIIYK